MTTKSKFRPARELIEKKYGRMTFARFVRMVRMDLELTQVEFAKKLRMASGTLCDIEKGRQNVSVKLAAKIAKLGDQLDRAKIKMKIQVQSA